MNDLNQNLTFLFEAVKAMPYGQMALFVLAAIIWFGGVRSLFKVHYKRMKNDESYKNKTMGVPIHNFSGKEWGIFLLLLVSAFVCGILAVNYAR